VTDIKVAFDMTFAQRNRGGSGTYARALFSSMRNRDGAAVWEIKGPAQSDFVGTMGWLLRGARSAVLARTPDIVHCPSFVAPWRLPVPFVTTVHDAGARRFPADHPLEWRVYDRALIAGRLRAAARVITGSEFARAEIIEAYGLPPERIVVVPYGIDERFFAPISPAEKPEPCTMLFPGAPVQRKNLEPVLRSMAAAAGGSSLAHACLCISGAGHEDFPMHAALITSLGLEDRVRWLGQVSPEDMPAVMAGANVVVYPSLSEGFGFPALEALAVGTPVVAGDRGSLPEILGDAALFVDPADVRSLGTALEAALSNQELRDRLRELGRAHARRYTWDRCVEGTQAVYSAVLHERQAGA
jgi:glycosyltransferase involved in cell wall biosynthesis